jgi:hypothetical protein
VATTAEEVADDEPGEADAIGVDDGAVFGGDVVGLFGEGLTVEVAAELCDGGELCAFTRVTGPSASKAMARNETIVFITILSVYFVRLSKRLASGPQGRIGRATSK